MACFGRNGLHDIFDATSKQFNYSNLQRISEKTNLSLKSIRILYRRFKRISVGGYLSFEKFRETLGMIGMLDETFLSERMFAAFDLNGDGKLDFEEFVTSIGIMINGTAEQKMNFSFRIFKAGLNRQEYGISENNQNKGKNIEDSANYFSSQNEEDFISLEEFRTLSKRISATQTALLGGEKISEDEKYIEELFCSLCSTYNNKAYRMNLRDFYAALKNSPEFLAVLGLLPKSYALESNRLVASESPYLKSLPVSANEKLRANEVAAGTYSEGYSSTNQTKSIKTFIEQQKLIKAEITSLMPLLNELLLSLEGGKKSLVDKKPSVLDKLPGEQKTFLDKIKYINSFQQLSSDAALQENNLMENNNQDNTISLRENQHLFIENLQSVGTQIVDGFANLKDENISNDEKRSINLHTKVKIYEPQKVRKVFQTVENTQKRAYEEVNPLQPEAIQSIVIALQKISKLADMNCLISDSRSSNNIDYRMLPESAFEKECQLPFISHSESPWNSHKHSECPNFPAESLPDSPPRMYMNRFHQMDRSYRQKTTFFLDKNKFKNKIPNTMKSLIFQKSLELGGRSNPGIMVHFGHENWNLVLNMMIGIRLAAGRANYEPKRIVEPYDFAMKEKLSILPRSSVFFSFSNRKTKEAVRFIDYAPMVFRRIREYFGIFADSYIRSVGLEQLLGNMLLGNLSSLSELVSEGKSGALFYYTADGRLMIKTISRNMAKFLHEWLPQYYKHCMENPDTLLTRFYGFHAIRMKRNWKKNTSKGSGSQKLYFVVMGNFLHAPVEIHRRYDLKGSTLGRSIPNDKRCNPGVTMKDLDLLYLNEKIEIPEEKSNLLLSQLTKDCEMLESFNIMDYSLLLGVHYVNYISDTLYHLKTSERLETSRKSSFHNQSFSGISSKDGMKIYFFGIIDISTRWNATKKAEGAIKGLKWKSREEISCVNPTIYSERLRNFIKKLLE